MAKAHESLRDFQIGSSRLRDRALVILHALGLAACWFNGLPVTVRGLASVMLAGLWYGCYLHDKSNQGQLSYTAQRRWSLALAGSEPRSIVIKPTTVISRVVIFLHYETHDQRTRTLLVFKDAMPADLYRQLLVKLTLSGYAQNQ